MEWEVTYRVLVERVEVIEADNEEQARGLAGTGEVVFEGAVTTPDIVQVELS